MICKCCGRDLDQSCFRVNKLGVSHVCKECWVKKGRETREKKHKIAELEKEAYKLRNLRLSDFKAVDLMSELKRRGYTFTMNYTRVEVISSDDIEVS